MLVLWVSYQVGLLRVRRGEGRGRAGEGRRCLYRVGMIRPVERAHAERKRGEW
jgi:hypothetical protein